MQVMQKINCSKVTKIAAAHLLAKMVEPVLLATLDCFVPVIVVGKALDALKVS